MNIDTQPRELLKTYFVKNAIPTQANFEELIDASLNQHDDGIAKPPGDPLSIEASGGAGSRKEALRLYESFVDDSFSWVLALNPSSDPADPVTARAGFSIHDGAGRSRLFIDKETGNVGLGTLSPANELTVAGQIRAANKATPENYLQIGHGGANSFINFAGAGSLHIRHEGDTRMALNAQGDLLVMRSVRVNAAPSNANGRTLVLGSGNGSQLRLGYHADYSWIQSHGQKPLAINPLANRVGIGTVEPTDKLHVENGDVRITGGRYRRLKIISDTHWAGMEIVARQEDGQAGNPHIDFTHGDLGDPNFGIRLVAPTNDELRVDGGDFSIQGDLRARKYVIQDGVDGGRTKGLWMWQADDSNWGIYMAQPGDERSLAGGKAVTGEGFSGFALRLRTHDRASDGIIFENSKEERLLSVRASDGLTFIRGGIVQETWQAVTFRNEWENFGEPFNEAGYFKDSLGIVHLRGGIQGGKLSTPPDSYRSVFKLPSGYRPERQEVFAASAVSLIPGRVDIRPNGDVCVTAENNSGIALDGMTFRASR
ncbi:MAG: hypothetical protein AAGD38_10995 [Acidobacteriota bacterium]